MENHDPFASSVKKKSYATDCTLKGARPTVTQSTGRHPEIVKRFPKDRDDSLGTTDLNRLFDVRCRHVNKFVDVSVYIM